MHRIPFVGPFPPPVHGQAIATETIALLLENHGVPLRRLDTGEAGTKGRWGGLLRRAIGLLRASFFCLAPGTGTAYLSVSANKGMVFTVALAGLARLAGKRPVLHHHTYAHVAHHSRNMDLLIRAAGASAVHLTICPAMSQELAATYPQVRKTAAFSNLDAVDPALLDIKRDRTAPATLGFMSNLTSEKGVQRAIATLREARAQGLSHRLVLAGPCSDDRALAAIEAASIEFGDAFSYLGPVGGASKLKFFADIDVFLFPSLYRNETQGIVNLEALAAGLPVVAYGQCCIPSDLNDPSCAVLSPNLNFETAALDFVRDLAPRYREACEGARARFRTLTAAHTGEVDNLVALLADAASLPPPQSS
ncbi:MAG: glycosyltransferase family 4 protein [Devosia sp.]